MKIIAKREAILTPAASRDRRRRTQADDADPGERAACSEGRQALDHCDGSRSRARRDVGCRRAAGRGDHASRPQAAGYLPRVAGGHRNHADAGRRADAGAGRARAASRCRPCPRPNFRRSRRSTPSRHSGLPQKEFKRLLDKTHFSMAQQDVRYYLNGLLLETSAKLLRTVATDGHRLALCETELPEGGKPGQQVIIPRKGVLELQRILGNEEGALEVSIGSNHLRVKIDEIRFTSKLIDGRFPEYGRVIPAEPPRLVGAVRDDLRQALQRAAILSNEKYRGIRFALKTERADHPVAQSGAGRGRGGGRGDVRRARSSRSAST